MKSFLIIVGVFVAVAYADLVTEREALFKYQKECEDKLGEPKNLIEKLSKPDDLGDVVKAGNMALCINVKIGNLNEDGTVITDKFVEHVHKINNDEAQRKTIIDECGKKNGSTPHEAALNFMKCMKKHAPVTQIRTNDNQHVVQFFD